MSPNRGRLLALLVVVAAVASLVPGCKRGAKVEGEGRLDPTGRVLLTRDDQLSTVTRSRSLVSGDAVEVSEGDAKVTLPGGDVIELRPGSVLFLDDGPELRRGNALVTATGPARTVRTAGNQVDATGATRIDVSLALRVVAYGGRAVVRSGGRTLEVPALREALVPVIGVLRGPVPLVVDSADPWDQRFLGDAAAKEPELESRARGFTGQVAPRNATSLAYYRTLLPDLNGEPAFQQADIDKLGGAGAPATGAGDMDRFRAGDVLLGAAIALQGRRGTFAERLAGATAFRGEGASWALVSLDQQVPSIDGLLRLVDGAVNSAPLELAAPAPVSGTLPPPEPPPGQATTTAPPRRSSAPTTRTGRPAPTTTQPPRQQARPPQPAPAPAPPPQPAPIPGLMPLNPLIENTVDPISELLDDLLGG